MTLKTLILPGFSLKNRDWVEEVVKNLPEFQINYLGWKHWKTGNSQDFSLEAESNRVIKAIGGDQINLIAKSIGTLVAVVVLPEIADAINRLILCGLPLYGLTDKEKEKYKTLQSFPSEKVVVFQNEADSHGSFEEAKKLFQNLTLPIKIVSKPRADHEYPYFEDFRKFLTF